MIPGMVAKWQWIVLILAGVVLAGVLLFWQRDALWGAQGAGTPGILYLGWAPPERDSLQLFLTDSRGTTPRQLTQATADSSTSVTHFAVSPDGRQIAYAVQSADDESALWLMTSDGRRPRLLLTCRQAFCGDMVWAADNRRLIYERREVQPDGSPGSPRLWWLDTQTGETVTLLENEQTRGVGARLSPDGTWVTYLSPEDEQMKAYNFVDGRAFTVPIYAGAAAVWNPQGGSFLIADFDLLVSHGRDDGDHLVHSHDYQEVVYLFRVDLDDPVRRRISPEGIVDDGAAAWSPDGQWIAFGRKRPRTAMGRQLWLMRPDGSEARPLTDEPTVHHGPPAWSPDGRYLLFQRYDSTTPDAQPGIWLLEVATGQMQQVVAGGMQPAWVGVSFSTSR